MAADYTVDVSARLITVVYTGRLTLAEMYDLRKRWMSDAAFNSSFSQLVDARAVTHFEMNGYTMKQWAKEHVAADGARRAIVLGRNSDFGLARMFQIHRELAGGGEETQLFRNLEDALKWVGQPGK